MVALELVPFVSHFRKLKRLASFSFHGILHLAGISSNPEKHGFTVNMYEIY